MNISQNQPSVRSREQADSVTEMPPKPKRMQMARTTNNESGVNT